MSDIGKEETFTLAEYIYRRARWKRLCKDFLKGVLSFNYWPIVLILFSWGMFFVVAYTTISVYALDCSVASSYTICSSFFSGIGKVVVAGIVATFSILIFGSFLRR